MRITENNTTIGITILIIIILIHCPISYCWPWVLGNGFKRDGGDWWGTNTLNDANIIDLFVFTHNITWCVPSSGNIYFTEKSPFGTVIFSNLNSLWPLVTTTLALKSFRCCFVSLSWTLNCRSVKVSIIGFSGK